MPENLSRKPLKNPELGAWFSEQLTSTFDIDSWDRQPSGSICTFAHGSRYPLFSSAYNDVGPSNYLPTNFETVP